MIIADADFDRAVVATFPAVVKGYYQAGSNRRIVEVAASNESVDLDGDVVLQKALLEAAPGFLRSGHLDIDHLSEFGDRLGIKNPSSYIIGRPIDVRRGEGTETIVEGEICRSVDGKDDPSLNKFDEFWATLRREPPVVWFASIYGWPTDIEECADGKCVSTGATRYVIKSIDWRSLAFTRTPKNTSLTKAARVVTAKSYLGELVKSLGTGGSIAPATQIGAFSHVPPQGWSPDTIRDAASPCPNCEVHKTPSLLGYKTHFMECKGCSEGGADILAHACMYKHYMDRSLPMVAPNLGPTSGL
jgi:hypothetical protein